MIGKELKEFMIIKKLSSEEKQLKIIEKNNEMTSLIKKEKGVKNIIEKIIELKKPIVGHNCFIDFLFIMSHFIEEIPKNYKEYKIRLKNLFRGGIYDTKYLYNSSNLNFNENKEEINLKNNIHLESLYTNLTKENNKLDENKKIKIKIPNDFNDYLNASNSSKFHQADYDSFTTGCSYIFMQNILGEKFIKEHENKLNCYRGLYSCYDLNNYDNKEKYLNNSSDVFIISFKNRNITENIFKIRDEIINSKYINIKLNSKELGDSTIIFINSENKLKFKELIDKYKDIIYIETIEKFRDEIKYNEKKNFCKK